MRWPTEPGRLERLQAELASLRPEPWRFSGEATVGGCYVCFPRGGRLPGRAGEPGWAAAVVWEGGSLVAEAVVEGEAGAPYVPGLLAAREGPLLEGAVAAVSRLPDVLLVSATGRDHPRCAGLALHLGWALDLPTVGVTHRPLLAEGEHPGPWVGACSSLFLEGEQVGWWLRTRPGALPLAVSVGWRTDPETCRQVVMGSVAGVRTPEPIRHARRLARMARGGAYPRP